MSSSWSAVIARRWRSVSSRSDVEVVAPIDAPLEKIFEKVRKRAPWIRRQQRFFPSFSRELRNASSFAGKRTSILGGQYKLKVVPHIQQQVKLYRGRIVVQSHSPRSRQLTKG